MNWDRILKSNQILNNNNNTLWMNDNANEKSNYVSKKDIIQLNNFNIF